jgi:hypothetical protein
VPVTGSRPPLPARVLAALLVVWEPLTFALTASAALPRLVIYGLPAFALLAYRGLVVGLGIAAGRALWAGRTEGPTLARSWAILHATAVVLTFATPYFPSNRVPGAKGPVLALLLLIDGAWWAWLRWSTSVRRAYGDRP